MDWEQIANKLTASGARHKRGQLISAQQLRTEFARLKREPKGAVVNPSEVDQRNEDPPIDAPNTATSPATGGAVLRGFANTGEDRPGGGALEKLSELLNTRIRTVEVDDD
jgi:hypothetical protein